VVVHDLDVRRAFRRPNKAHPELVVDPDRVLPLAIARQPLKTVAWRRPQVAEIARRVELAQFPARHLDQIGRKALGTFAIEDRLGGLVREVSDHQACVSLDDTDVNGRVSSNGTTPIWAGSYDQQATKASDAIDPIIGTPSILLLSCSRLSCEPTFCQPNARTSDHPVED
jgi:hypothetical protein